MNAPSPALGHNQRDIAAELRSQLEADHADLLKRRDELLASVARMPATVENDDMAGKFSDTIKLITGASKAAEDRRVTTKEPYLAAGRAVDGFFKGVSEPLTKAKAGVERTLTAYLRAKAEAERKRREEEERRQREEAERAAREAAEREAAMQEEDDIDAAIEAEERARQAAADAAQAAKAAAAKPAELSRTRGDYGAVSSLRRVWIGEIVDRAALDLDKLRPYFAEADLQKALNGLVRAGGRECAGAKIYETTNAVVR